MRSIAHNSGKEARIRSAVQSAPAYVVFFARCIGSYTVFRLVTGGTGPVQDDGWHYMVSDRHVLTYSVKRLLRYCRASQDYAGRA